MSMFKQYSTSSGTLVDPARTLFFRYCTFSIRVYALSIGLSCIT